MDKIQLPDGSLVSIEQAQSLFNDQYQTFIDDGTLKIVSEEQMSNNIFISPDGSEMTEKQARDLYKKQFQSFVNDGTLKKKGDTPSSGQEVPTESTTETETIPGSSDSLEGQGEVSLVQDDNGDLTPFIEIPPVEQEEEVEISIPDAPSRKGILQNEDGSVSTHKMRTETDGQGNWFSFPTVFQNEDGSFVDMSEQAKQNWEPVYEEAKKRGEVIEFGKDEKSALAYGKGSWKNKFDARNNNELLNSVGYIEAKGQNRNILDDLKEKGDERVDDIIMEKTYPVMENGQVVYKKEEEIAPDVLDAMKIYDKSIDDSYKKNYDDVQVDFEDFEKDDIPDAEKLQSLDINLEDYLKWDKVNTRQEGSVFKFFKTLLTSEEGDEFEKEQRQYEKVQSYQATVLNGITNDLEKNKAQQALTTDANYLKELKKEEELLAGDFYETLGKINSTIDLFPKFKELTDANDLKKRRRLFYASRKGGMNEFEEGVRQKIRIGTGTGVNYATKFFAGIPGFFDQRLSNLGYDKKGLLAGLSEMLSDSAEHYDIDYGATNRSAFIDGKPVTYKGEEFFVDSNGKVYDKKTNLLMDGIIGQDAIKEIQKRSKNVPNAELQFTGGSVLDGTTGTLVNLFALIGSGQKVNKTLGLDKKLGEKLAGKVGMGLASFTSGVVDNVEDIRSQLMATGMSEKEAMDIAVNAGQAISTLDGVFSGIAGSNEKLLTGFQGIKDQIKNLAINKGKDFTKKQLTDKGFSLTKEFLRETGFEELPVYFSEKGINNLVNRYIANDVLDDNITRAGIAETVVMTIGATSALGSRKLLTGNKRADLVRLAAKNVENLQETLDALVKEGSLTKKEAMSAYTEIYNMQTAENKTKGTIVVSENMQEASDLLTQRQNLINEKQGLEGPLKDNIDKRIADVDSQLDALYKRDKQQARDIIKGEQEGTIEVTVTKEEALESLKIQNEANERLGLPTVLESDENILKEQNKLIKERRALKLTDGPDFTKEAVTSLKEEGIDNPTLNQVADRVEQLTKQKEDAISKPSTEEQVLPDAPTSTEGGKDSEVELQQVGEGDVEQVTPDTQVQEGETQTDKPSDTTTETDVEQLTESTEAGDVSVNKETYQVPGSRTIDVEVDKNGKPTVVNRKTGKKVDKIPAKAQDFILTNVVDVNEGSKAKIPEGANPEQVVNEIAENSNNIKEVSEAINQLRTESENTQESKDIGGELGGLVNQKTKRPAIKFTAKSWKRVTGLSPKESGVSNAWIATEANGGVSIEDGFLDIVSLPGELPVDTNQRISSDQVVEFIKQYPNVTALKEANTSTQLTDLEIKFEQLTGLKATPRNIETVVGIDPNREPIALTKERSKESTTKESAEKESEGVSKLRDALRKSGTTVKRNTAEQISKLGKQIENAKKALSKILPDVEIIMPSSEAEYKRLTGESANQNSGGTYIDGKIYINPNRASSRVVSHEVFHAVLLSKGMSEAQAKAITERMLSAVKKSASKELLDKIDKFSKRYPEALQSEESIAELVGILASEYDTLPKPSQNIVKRWLDKLAKIFGLKPFTDVEVVDLLNTLASKVESGQEVSAKDVKILGSKDSKNKTEARKSRDKSNLAPNGKPSNLNTEQYNIVRTPEFKNWFGDWQTDPENASKVVDENGEPKVVYHGSPAVDIDVFNRSESKRNSSGLKEFGSYFSSNKKLSELYAQANPKKEYEVYVKGQIELLNGNLEKTRNNKAYNEINAQIEKYKRVLDSKGEIYPVFLNIRKMKTFDGNGEANIEAWRNLQANAGYKIATNRDAMEVYAGFNSKVGDKMKVDGIEATNIIEMSIGTSDKNSKAYKDAKDKYIGDAYLVFDSTENAAKLADGSNTEFDPNNPSIRKSSSKPTIEEIVSKGKELGASDADIRQIAQEEGYANKDTNSEIEKYDTKKREAAQKAEKLFVKGGKIAKSLDFLRRWALSARGFLPKSMQIGKEVLTGAVAANAKQAENNLKDLQRYIKNQKKSVQDKLVEDLNAYMRGDADIDTLPSEMAPIAYAMRNHIDSLSMSLVESGAITDIKFDQLSPKQKKELIKEFGTEEEARKNYKSQKDNIIDNLGSYLNRSFEVFDNKDYSPSDAVLNAAKAKLREQYAEAAKEKALEENNDVDAVLEEMVDNALKKILSREEGREFLNSSKLGSKNISVLKEKIDIPAEIRALMGEYTDPALNYVRSVNKIAALVANQEFLSEMKKAGEGVFFFNKPTGEYNVLIAPKGSKTYNPLNGMYTSKAIKDVVLNTPGATINDSVLNNLLNFYYKMVGIVKYSKTILSPATHAKNVIGNLFFMAYNGYTNPKVYFDAANVVFSDLRSNDKKNHREKMQEYIKAGIINQSSNLGEIRALLQNEGSLEDIMVKRMNSDSTLFERLNRVRKKIGKGAEATYQAEDDVFKIISFEMEKKRYSKALFNKTFDKLSPEQQKEVTDKVTEIVKNILPNYSRIGGLGKFLKAVPIVGTFISFQIEAMRTAYNVANLALSELKDINTAGIGVKRLTGILSVTALKAAILPMLGVAGQTLTEAIKSAIGDEEEEEEKEGDVITESARQFLPKWAENSNIIITKLDSGKFEYVNFSASDPHAFIDKAIISAFRGETAAEGMGNAVTSLIEPFVTPDILFKATTSTETDYGKKIFNETDTPNEIAKKIGGILYTTFEPGGATSARKIFKAYEDKDKSLKNEIIGQLTGFKVHTVDFEKQLIFKSLDLRKRVDLASKDYSKAYYERKNKDISEDDLRERYNVSNEKYQSVMKEGVDLYKSALRLGSNRFKIERKMEGYKKLTLREFSYIRNGNIPELKKKKTDKYKLK
jgi:hypothetical protein